MTLKKECRYMTSANKYIGEILKTFKEGEIINDIYILELINYHPDETKIDINNIEWLKMLPRPPFGKLALFFKCHDKDAVDDISWKSCVRNIYGKYNKYKESDKQVTNAFRTEIWTGTRQAFLKSNTSKDHDMYTGVCNNCDDETTDFDVDHYRIPFIQIMDEFRVDNKIDNLHTIEVYENENCEIKFKDRSLADKWLKYHDDKACYRMLCKRCNSSLSCGNYKSIF